MSTLYLHIGTPKTGTSAIQYFMANNRKLLKSAGYSYPDLGMSFPGIGEDRNAHFLIYKIYDKEKNNLVEKEDELVTKGLDKISEIAKTVPNIVISDEGIWHGAQKKEKFWENLKRQLNERGIDLKIVVYLRRQDLFINSFWAQQVKETSTISFDKFISGGSYKKFILDYYSHLNNIADVAGKTNIIVRVYEKQTSIIPDFLDSIHLKFTDEYHNPDIINNTSITGVCLEVKRLLNKMPEYKEKKSFIVPLLKDVQTEMIQDTGFQKPHYFSQEQQLQFLKQYEEGNSAIAREYINREDGVLFKDSIEVNDNSKINTYSTEELIAVCGKIIALQQQNIEKYNILKAKLLKRYAKKIWRNLLKIAIKVKRAFKSVFSHVF